MSVVPDGTGARIVRHAVFWARLACGAAGFSAAIAALVVMRTLRLSKAGSRRAFVLLMSRLTCRPLGIRLRVSGEAYIEQESPCIFVANHQSYIDYPVAGRVFPAKAIVMARQVGNLPLLGWLFRDTDNISVDRDEPHRAAAALFRAREAIVHDKLSIWIFPEGTRGNVRGKLAPFKRGAFRLALDAGVPIVGIVIAPLAPHTDLRGRRLDSRVLDIRVLPPLTVADYGTYDETALRDRVRSDMQQTLTAITLAQLPSNV